MWYSGKYKYEEHLGDCSLQLCKEKCNENFGDTMSELKFNKLLELCKEILVNNKPKIDTYEITLVNNMLFLIIGYNKNTADIHDSITIDEFGNRINYAFIEKHVVASGIDDNKLIKSVKRYKTLCSMTTDTFIKKIINRRMV
jgi:hypothetical protein